MSDAPRLDVSGLSDISSPLNTDASVETVASEKPHPAYKKNAPALNVGFNVSALAVGPTPSANTDLDDMAVRIYVYRF
jgi:hypothetical protein